MGVLAGVTVTATCAGHHVMLVTVGKLAARAAALHGAALITRQVEAAYIEADVSLTSRARTAGTAGGKSCRIAELPG